MFKNVKIYQITAKLKQSHPVELLERTVKEDNLQQFYLFLL